MSFVKKYCKMQKNVLDKSRFILNTLTKKKIETLLISLQSSRVCQSAVVLLKKRLYQNCFRFAQQFWSTQTQMHFASPLSFTLINTLHLSKCLNKPLWPKLTGCEYLVQITFYCIYIDKWYLSVEHKVFTYSSFCTLGLFKHF